MISLELCTVVISRGNVHLYFLVFTRGLSPDASTCLVYACCTIQTFQMADEAYRKVISLVDSTVNNAGQLLQHLNARQHGQILIGSSANTTSRSASSKTAHMLRTLSSWQILRDELKIMVEIQLSQLDKYSSPKKSLPKICGRVIH